jgi:response regulator RpfG family c-di-GMP phosphodiesterase
MDKCVLIVDDSRTARVTTAHWVKQVWPGVNIIECVNGESALEVATGGQTINIALVDVNMPGICGMETATKLTVLDNVGRVYLVTANVGNNIEDEAESRGIGLLFKPFSVEKFEEIVNR